MKSKFAFCQRGGYMSKQKQKTKKQHYVPRCYLDAWAIPNTYQVHVYDKKMDKTRINSINDIASENYFYDVALDEVISHQIFDNLRKQDVLTQNNLISQGIEHAFANDIEGPFSQLLKELISKSESATPWTINNCYFISEQKKSEMSAFLSLQFIRIKQVRNNIIESADCLSQALKDMGVSTDMIERYSVPKKETKNIHVQMLMDYESLSEITQSFFNFTWILGVNRTEKKFYTSDSPIGTLAHVKHPFMSMGGLKSEGVEVFFPISPTCILIMVDGSYHTNITQLERRYLVIDDVKEVDCYNSLCAMRSERCVFSTDGSFLLIEEMKKDNPSVFSQPHTQLTWNNKTYFPTN